MSRKDQLYSWVSDTGWLPAFACESASVLAAWHQHWVLAALLHVMCASALALVAARAAQRQRPGEALITPALAIGSWALSLPVLGPLGIAAIVLPAWRGLASEVHDRVLEFSLPEPCLLAASSAAARSPIADVLREGSWEQARIAAVMELRLMPAERAVPLLRLALLDPYEDVRLLAYAILERREKQLRASIETDLRALKSEAAAQAGTADVQQEPQARLQQRLCERHWELVHGGFVNGEVERQTLSTAASYGEAAIRLRPDGSLALLLARVQLRRGDALAALRCLEGANRLGVGDSLCAPFLAEATFMLGRFDLVAAHLARRSRAGAVPAALRAVCEFWTGQSPS